MTSAGSVEGDARLRLFLALQLPSTTLDALETWMRERLQGAGRAVPREHLHVTLAFLGSRPATDLDAVVETLRAASSVARPITLAPVRWRETRSVGMIALEDLTGEATALATRLHARLSELGLYRPEARPWLPHVTVLRFRSRPRLDPPLPAMGTFVPSGAAAYLSHLHPSGARYEVLDSVSLTAGG
jgi:2'-5' RNA ligase